MTGRVLILGGGITGLAAAHYLLREEPGLDVTVLESEERAGGNIGSERVEGLILEKGPNGLVDTAPQGLALARELGLGDRLLASSPGARKRFVWRTRRGRGRLHAVGPLEVLTSSLLTLRGRLRLLGEPLVGRADPEVEESVAAFGRRRFGREFTAALLDPFVTGVFAGDVERLSMAAAFPRVARIEKEHGSIFRGVFAARRARTCPGDPRRPPGAPSIWSFPGGLEELIGALETRLGGRLRLRAPVERVARTPTGCEVHLPGGESLPAEAVLCTLPPPGAASVLGAASPALAKEVGGILQAPVAVACLAFRREDVGHPLDGLGFLIPRGERLRTLGVIFSSSLFPSHAPDGVVSLRALAGGALDPGLASATDEDLLPIILSELGPILGLHGEPFLRRVYRHRPGIPQYNLGHPSRLRRIEEGLRGFPGLFLAGYAYRGVGINDSLEDARRAGTAILDHLRRASGPG